MLKQEKILVFEKVNDFCDKVSNKEKVIVQKNGNKLTLEVKPDPFKGMTEKEVNDYFANDFSF